ncbi:hypothetical protein MnTg02_00578 [bacterium MnTg02]|nr:hypothetical protein MnTg02_00578 [bacterium MnTg02]
MWCWLKRSVHRMHKDQRGNVILLFLLALIPLLAGVAVAMDLGYYLVVKRNLANALDAAVLAVGNKSSLITVDGDGNPIPAQQAAANAFARSYIYANYPYSQTLEGAGKLTFTVIATEAEVMIDAVATIDTIFLPVLQLIGASAADLDTLDVIVSTKAARGQINLEVFLALDNTGSMGSSGDDSCGNPPCTKLDNLKDAANAMLDVFFGTGDTSDNIRIGLVPFSGAVNIGTDKQGIGWLDETRLSSVHSENLDWSAPPPGVNNIFDLYDQIDNAQWGGCVRARTEDFDVSDDPPDILSPDTLWTPYFAPDEPDDPGPNGPYTNNYLSDGDFAGTPEAIQANMSKYADSTASGNGPNYNCVPQPIQPLTNSKSTISSAIAGMVADGYTVIPQGLAWAWRGISPTEPFTGGVPYDDPETKKAIILLTDGANNVFSGNNNFNKGNHTAYGYPGQDSGHLGASSGSEAVDVLNAKVATLCNNIKAVGIILYTITFQVASGSAIETIFQNCASDQNDPVKCPTSKCAFASSENLTDVFKEIALGLNKLRLAE